VARMGRDDKRIQNFVERPEGKKPVGKLSRRWEDNIKMDLRNMWWEGVDWMRLDQDRDLWRAF